MYSDSSLKDQLTAIEAENRYLANVYFRYPITIVRGNGSSIWDDQGKEYIDCMGGYGVSVVGHNNPKVVEAVKNQVEKLISCHGTLYNDTRAKFAEKIVSISPDGLERAHLCSTGTEAVECAIKLARKKTGRTGVVAMTGGYHGKTLGSLSVTWNPKYRTPFKPLLPDMNFASFGKIESVEENITGNTAAVLVEPIQGESGIHVSPEGFLEKLRSICDKRGCLLIFDEIQSGFGRTGKMWASEHWNVNPDIMCISKGIGGGLPLGVTLSTDEIMSSFKVGDHSSTFGGNPVACAAGSAAIDYILEEGLVERASRIGKLFRENLERLANEHKIARETRGLGLMLGLELRLDVKELLLRSIKEGIILLYSGRNNLRFLPPLVIEEKQVAKVMSILDVLLTTEDARIS